MVLLSAFLLFSQGCTGGIILSTWLITIWTENALRIAIPPFHVLVKIERGDKNTGNVIPFTEKTNLLDFKKNI